MICRDSASFGALLDGDGDVTDYIKLKGITKKKNAFNQIDRGNKVQYVLIIIFIFSVDKNPMVEQS